MTIKLSFKPKQVSKSLLSALHERSRDIIERRYGLLNDGTERMTLEAIGEIYGITRERVRQIENASLAQIKKSENYNKAQIAFDELLDAMVKHGGLVKEEAFLGELAKDESTQNHINFLLVVGEPFIKIREDDDFHHRWTTNPTTAESVHGALHNLHGELSEQDIISETEIIVRFIGHLKEALEEEVDNIKARRWLGISKVLGSNALGEWGLATAPHIRARGMRDLAYLVLRKEGKPLHFTEVAENIETLFNRKAHIATTHNELIKDDRFVLVGRGLYALTEWGYTSGVVRDVIKKVLKEKGPLGKDELTKEVLKQRHVKENTIYVNLQNSRYFKKDPKGKYALV